MQRRARSLTMGSMAFQRQFDSCRAPFSPRIRLAAAFSALLLALVSLESKAADRLVLRNLTVITDRTVASFDVDGVKLDDGKQIAWDELERATVGPARQAEFDSLLKSLGEPLYRIRQRLRVGDYAGLVEPAEAVAPRLLGRASKSGYLVAQALMWGRMAAGRREEAVEPYFYCLDYLRKLKGPLDGMPGDRRLKFEPASGFSAELLPVWFDGDAAKKALPGVRNALRAIGGAGAPPESGYVYFATLSLAAGDEPGAVRVLEAVKATQPATREWLAIIAAEREVRQKKPAAYVAALSGQLEKLSAENRPAALYWVGQAKLLAASSAEKRNGVLQLLVVPASHGATHPEIAAACLTLAMESLGSSGDARGAVALRKELFERYGQTFHAAKVKSGSGSAPAPMPVPGRSSSEKGTP